MKTKYCLKYFVNDCEIYDEHFFQKSLTIFSKKATA